MSAHQLSFLCFFSDLENPNGFDSISNGIEVTVAILSVNEEVASTARNVIFKKRITLVFDPLLCYSLYPSLLKSFIYM